MIFSARWMYSTLARGLAIAEDSPSPYVWQFGLSRKPDAPADETPMCWEFRDFPRSSEQIYLRMRFQNKSNAAVNEKLEFVLPPVSKLEVRDTSIP